MKIDLRSDTVTKPTPAMQEAMFSAPVGDDVYGEDPTVNLLQEKAARLFGKEAALFCPSGTMTNQIAIKALSEPMDEVICFKGAHIYKYEGGGLFFNSGISVKLLDAPHGLIQEAEIAEAINPDNVHYPRTRIVALENTVNRGGGSTYSLGEIKSIRALCEKNSLSLHLDGARIFNALVARQQSPAELGQYFDSISVCLSKGLGCPVGSVLLGSKALIQKALRIRKVFGGGMRQAGYLAAAGIYALDYHIERLAEDHKRAKIIGTHLEQKAFVKAVLPVETNIVLFNLESYELLKELDQFCQRFDIQISAMDKTRPRVVCHLDFNDKMLEKFLQVIDSFDQEYQAKSRKVQALS